jgi:hypothetical protein
MHLFPCYSALSLASPYLTQVRRKVLEAAAPGTAVVALRGLVCAQLLMLLEVIGFEACRPAPMSMVAAAPYLWRRVLEQKVVTSRASGFSGHHRVLITSGAQPAVHPMDTVVKSPGREPHHSTLSTGELRTCGAIRPLRHTPSWCGV